MHVHRTVFHRLGATVLLFACFAAPACSSDTSPMEPNEPTSILGSLELTIEETGERPDTNGYEASITLAGTAGPIVRPIQQGTGSVVFPDLPTGRHSLTIQGLASHCSAGSQPRSFLVEAGITTTLRVAVFCPGPGALLIRTATRGRDIHVEGYPVQIDGDASTAVHFIGVNDSLLLGEDSLPPGAIRFVRLNGVPSNCYVDQEVVSVRALRGDTRRIEYTVACIPGSSLMAFEFQNGIHVGHGLDALNLTSGQVAAPSRGPSLSPDRSKVVFSTPGDINEGPGLLLVNTDGSGVRSLTSDTAQVFVGSQAWSPNGSRIVFWRSHGGPSNVGDIYVMNADGSGEIRLTNDGLNSSPAWSPDGSSIAFCKAFVFDVIDVFFEVYRMSVDGSGAVGVVEHGCDPVWSPDGSRIAYTDYSLFGPNPELAVVRADGTGRSRLQAAPSTGLLEGSRNPSWSPDGAQIAFTGGASGTRIWIVDFLAGAFGEPFPYRFGRAPSWR
jgi:hypothetical protein